MTDAESYSFDTPGDYTVGIRVTDSNGAATFGSFNVEVDPVATPEPGSLTLLGIGCVGLLGYAGLRRKRTGKVVPAV